jgi:endonuclease YncB( thermonuclease family)
MVGGHAVLRQQEVDTEDNTTSAAIPAEPATVEIPKNQPEETAVTSRAIDPEIVGLALSGSGQLERIEPRAPLSKLALATPPKPKMPDEWKGTTLFQPIASAAGRIDAMGRSVFISGIGIVDQDETCTDGKGVAWACGLQARSAFRRFLRGRAVVCAIPPEGGHDLVGAQCRLGKQDVGAWLVSNGWARAAPNGPYVKAQEVAQKAGMGIFGAAPDLSGLPPVPTPDPTLVDTAPADQPPGASTSGSILDLSGEPATPPVGQPAPLQ